MHCPSISWYPGGQSGAGVIVTVGVGVLVAVGVGVGVGVLVAVGVGVWIGHVSGIIFSLTCISIVAVSQASFPAESAVCARARNEIE